MGKELRDKERRWEREREDGRADCISIFFFFFFLGGCYKRFEPLLLSVLGG